MRFTRKLPAYPIFLKDPNFSLWSIGEKLNADNLHTWWGEEKRIYGFIRNDGQNYCFLGDAEKLRCTLKNARQTALNVTAFATEYEFEAGTAHLKLRFVSPVPPDDIELTSMPVCYMEYEVEGGNDVAVSLFVGREIAFNKTNPDKRVLGGVLELDGFQSAFLGLKKQLPLSSDGDVLGADWGYWYLAGEKACLTNEDGFWEYVLNGNEKFDNSGENKFLGAVNKARKGAILLGYDDIVSIDYFGEFLKGYYLKRHKITEALSHVWNERDTINRKLEIFDENLIKSAEKYGREYIDILYASLRQSVAGHKLTEDNEGNLLFLSKECYSNGCIGTVDISYPSMPLYLKYNPKLLKGMLLPILKFAKMPVWKYDFAPHDVGTYPACCGQVYGLKNNGPYKTITERERYETHFPYYLLPANIDIYDFNFQMPVEESANMLIMTLAYVRFCGDLSLYKNNKNLFAAWVEYLVKFGLKPENQLCTDDFAGHLKNNVNLSIKATVGIAAFAELCKADGEEEKHKKYRKIAEEFATEITQFGNKFTHIPLTWDSGEDTYSLKYNLAFDKLLGLKLFSCELMERETDYYITKLNAFGVPLDTRANYTKSDWLVWSAYLSDDIEKRKKLLKTIEEFLTNSPRRVPFSDWYDTADGEFYQFRARTVQGGCFILLLNETK